MATAKGIKEIKELEKELLKANKEIDGIKLSSLLGFIDITFVNGCFISVYDIRNLRDIISKYVTGDSELIEICKDKIVISFQIDKE